MSCLFLLVIFKVFFTSVETQQILNQNIGSVSEQPQDLIIEVGKNFTITCEYERNMTWKLPNKDQTIIYSHHKTKDLEDRSKILYFEQGKNKITAALTVSNASHLDTGFYECRNGNFSVKQYVFVHDLIEDKVETYTDNLLLPTLDLYRLDEVANISSSSIQTGNQLLPFKPVHPNVSFFLSKKEVINSSPYWIEVFSTTGENEKWSLDKHRGLHITGKIESEKTNGEYWLEAQLGETITTRYFRLFVTKGNEVVKENPVIKRAVEFRIEQSDSRFQLICLISAPWNVTWTLPNQRKTNFSTRYNVTNEGGINGLITSILEVRETDILDTGYYSCCRTDSDNKCAKQYIFVSSNEKLLLPTEEYYVLNHNEAGLIPCRPSHPDVEVSLYRDGRSNRGRENITLYPTTDKSEWTYNAFEGFRKDKVTREITPNNEMQFVCMGNIRNEISYAHGFQILVTELKLTLITEDSSSSVVVVEGDNVSLRCESYNYVTQFEWINRDGVRKTIYPYDERVAPSNLTKLYITDWKLGNISMKQEGEYRCVFNDSRLKTVSSHVYSMSVAKPSAPKISDSSENVIELQRGSTLELFCTGTGLPEPNITWIKEEENTNHTKLHKILTSTNDFKNGTFSISLANVTVGGIYSCKFANRIGNDSFTFNVTITEHLPLTPPNERGKMTAIFVVLGIIIVLLCCVLRLFYVRLKKKRVNHLRELQDAAKCLEPLLAGNPTRINPQLPLDEQSELLPYDSRWEFPRNRLKLGKQLGAGCFGRVVKADAEGITSANKTETVAVKMVRSYVETSALVALVSELKILIHLGSHLNIVNLLGACTDIVNGDFLVIVEYCQYDNLLNFLLSHRNNYINQVDKRGNLMTILPINHQQSGCVFLNTSTSAHRGVSKIIAPTETSIAQSLSFSTNDLVCWSFQVARGMDYLASRNVIHGDLAARNILLANDSVAKIADFGLSRKIYQDSNYKKKGEGMLPVKWMAIESLTDRVFSNQSDVWAFGVVLWECFTLGKTPYPEIEGIGALISHLETGNRMTSPQNAPQVLTDIMNDCWKPDPAQRPSFNALGRRLGDLLEPFIRQRYIELNEPYIRTNQERQRTTNNYLDLVATSTENNPGYRDDYINVGPLEMNELNENNTAVRQPETYVNVGPFIINEPMKGLPDRDVNQPTHIELHATVSAETNYLMMSGSSKA